MKRRVVVFEDDTASRNLITTILEQKGYEVVSAPDPMLCPIYSTLGDTCTHDGVCGDFLLTDNRMPYMSGLDLLEKQNFRGCNAGIQTKAIISASWSPSDRERAERLGCKTFDKPFNIKDLTEWLTTQEKLIPPGRKLLNLNPAG